MTYNKHSQISILGWHRKQISYRPYKRIASFNGYFLKEDFLDWLLDLEDLFDYENICYKRKVGLALYKLSKYALCWWE